MNLWIIDERLSYHYYLASDKSFSQMKDAVEISSRDRPDIIIFNNPAAFVDSSAPFHSIVLIEFKRPARNDFDNVENPITSDLRLRPLHKERDDEGPPWQTDHGVGRHALLCTCDL